MRGVQWLKIVVVVLLLPAGAKAVEAPRNPNSAKECALCHYRWVDTFFLDGRGSDLVPYQTEKVVAKPEMCFSCHDGSVVDSRARVYNDHLHPVDKPPPARMVIPAIFPLDEKGRMQCATCHTAHGVSSEMGMEKTIFLRASNENSAMCRMCHKDKGGGPVQGNHPVDSTKMEIPLELLEHGGEQGRAKNQIICQTCHTVHGSHYDKFLVETIRDSTICLACHKDKTVIRDTSHDLRRSAPESTNSKGKMPAESGLCGACHLVHQAQRVALWARPMPLTGKNPAQNLCLSCHDVDGVAKKKALEGNSHPVNVALPEKGVTMRLPVFDGNGRRTADGGVMSCPTCHDPHLQPAAAKADKAADGLRPAKGFLRVPGETSSALCAACHAEKNRVEKTDHDLRLTSPETRNLKGKLPAETGACGVCHLVHGGKDVSLWAREIPEQGADAPQSLCLSCHREQGPASKKVVTGYPSHPLNIDPRSKGLHTTLPLFNAQGQRKESGKMACPTCHDPHRWDPGRSKPAEQQEVGEGNSRNSFLRLPNAPVSQLCEDCHADQATVAKTDHDLNVTAAAAKNSLGQTPAESGVCGVCHFVHNGNNRIKLWAQSFGAGLGVMDRICTGCHSPEGVAKSKVPAVATHPEDKLITNVGRNIKGRPNYFPIYDNQTGKLKTVGDISCPSCHDVHQWDPKLKARGSGVNVEGRTTNSFLRMQTYNLMCIDCHGLDALFRFKYYHDSKKRGPEQR